MGLIKTAIMSGAGIYAVNKIAKVAENRHSNPNNQNQYPRDNYYSNEQNWGPPDPPPQRDYQYSDDRQGYAPNPQARSANRGAYTQREYNPADYATDKVEYDEDGWQVQRNGEQGPPPYASQPQQGGQGYVNAPRSYEYEGQSQNQQQQRGRGARLEGLANMAMGYLENGGKGAGKKGDRREKSGLSDFFGK
jgi:hypothetical protein